MLHKAIYGFEQSPMALFGKFSEAVIKFRLQCCHFDHSVFSNTSERGKILLIVYVNDFIIIGDDKEGDGQIELNLIGGMCKDGLGPWGHTAWAERNIRVPMCRETWLHGNMAY